MADGEKKNRHRLKRHLFLMIGAAFLAAGFAEATQAQQQPQTQSQNSGGKPNILVIFGDDIGQSNISAYTHGLMGYRTPNIDRIAHDRTMFTDSPCICKRACRQQNPTGQA